MNVTQTLITPEIAEEMLSKNLSNRTISQAHVKRLAKAMKEGRWAQNGDTICMNGERLIDGQHRLHAVILSKTPIQCLVVTDLDSSVFATKDIGKKRTGSDTLSFLGEHQTNILASSLARVKCLLEYQAAGKFSEKSRKVDNDGLITLLKQHGDIRHFLQTARNVRGYLPGPWGVALQYLFAKKDKDLAVKFFDELSNGVVSPDHARPLFLLREKLIRNGLNTKAKMGIDQILAHTIKAWNAMRNGESIQLLKWAVYEDFPTIK